MILIGSCSSAKLLRCVYDKVGTVARQEEAHRRIKAAVRLCDLKLQQNDGGDGAATFVIDGGEDEKEERRKDSAPAVELSGGIPYGVDASTTLWPPPTKK